MRLFVAICFDEPCKDVLCAAIAGLKSHARQGNFSRRESLHLTLAFLGETNRIDSAKRALGSIHAESFAMELAGLGCFQRSGGDLWWMGVPENGALTALQQQVNAALMQAGFSLEKRAFRPHLTLGRQVILEPGFRAKDYGQTLPPARMLVKEIALMESRRVNGLLQYVPRFVQPIG